MTCNLGFHKEEVQQEFDKCHCVGPVKIDDINKLIKDFGLKRPGEETDESNDIKD